MVLHFQFFIHFFRSFADIWELHMFDLFTIFTHFSSFIQISARRRYHMILDKPCGQGVDIVLSKKGIWGWFKPITIFGRRKNIH
jgi:hypothetical protein